MVFSTYFGGNGRADAINALVVSKALDSNAIHAAGATDSNDLKGNTNEPGDRYDGFVARIGPRSGEAGFVTYVGGSGDDSVSAIAEAVRQSGSVLVATGTSTSADLFGSGIEVPGSGDPILVLLDGASGEITRTIAPGGGGFDFGTAVAVDGESRYVMAGRTTSENLATTSSDAVHFASGGWDGFIGRFVDLESALGVDYFSYLGSPGLDEGITDLDTDGHGDVHVFGYADDKVDAFENQQTETGASDCPPAAAFHFVLPEMVSDDSESGNSPELMPTLLPEDGCLEVNAETIHRTRTTPVSMAVEESGAAWLLAGVTEFTPTLGNDGKQDGGLAYSTTHRVFRVSVSAGVEYEPLGE